MKNSLRSLSWVASLAAVALAAPALATSYVPIEDAELFRRADAVVVARATSSTVVASTGGLPETRTTFAVVDSLAGPEMPWVEVAVLGGSLPDGLTLDIPGMPRYAAGGLYVVALKARPDGAFVPAELGLGSFEVVRDDLGRQFATRSLFRREKFAVLQREPDGSLSARPEPYRELAAFTSWVRAGLYREPQDPGVPAYVVNKAAGTPQLVRDGAVAPLWDNQWCPGGAPAGSCGNDFTRYRWVDPQATVRWCDEDVGFYGQSGVAGGGVNEFQRAVFLWTADKKSDVRYTYAAPLTGTCNPTAVPAAGTIPIYLDDLTVFGGTPFYCPWAVGGAIAIGGVVTDNSTHVFKGTTYKTIRAGIGWVRRGDGSCTPGTFSNITYETVIANILGSTLGFSPADLSRNPNDLDPSNDDFALMVSTYLTEAAPVLGKDDEDGLCYVYGPCLGEPVYAKLFVPFVGRVAGAGAANFTSEVALTNRSATDSIVTLSYVPSLGTGRGAVNVEVKAGRQLVIADIIEFLRSKGLDIAATGDAAGTMTVAFDRVYEPDATVTVRTGVPVPPGVDPPVGRAGLAYLGVKPSKLLLKPAWIVGLRQTLADRSNIAFQHAGTDTDGNIRIRATWYSATGVPGATPVERTLSAGGWTQFPLTTLEPTAVSGYVKVELVEGRAPWYAYGIVNDNKNSDGSYVGPIPNDDILAQENLILPVAVEAGQYVTEIILDNVSTVDKTVNLKWVADNLPSFEVTVSYPLPKGSQLVIPDWVQVIRTAGFPIPPKGTRLNGAIFVKVPNGTVAGIAISARVLNPATDTPTAKATDWGLYGVHYPGVTTTCLATQASWLGGLRQDDVNRTNLAIINTGEIDGTVSTYLVELFDGDTGTKAGEKIVQNLPYERYIQLDRVFLQIADWVKNGFIRVTAISGPNPFITYAVVNDGSAPEKRSGDGAYIQSEIVGVQ